MVIVNEAVRLLIGPTGQRSPKGATMKSGISRWSLRRRLLAIAVGVGVAAVTAACVGKSESAAGGGRVNVGSVNDVRTSLASQKYVRSTEGRLFLLPAADNAVIAVSWKCTHLGCTLPPPNPVTSGNIQCPCHAAVFDSKTGIRLSGPANRPTAYNSSASRSICCHRSVQNHACEALIVCCGRNSITPSGRRTASNKLCSGSPSQRSLGVSRCHVSQV